MADPKREQTPGTGSMSDGELMEGFTKAVQKAIRDTHAAGHWTVHLKGDAIVRVYPDGREEIIRRLESH